jgi:precorrin-2/cobalt-factor-2 C20-methyltransferase
MATVAPGMLYVVGVGPGDPELMTLKAARVIAMVPVVAFFAKRGRPGLARTVVAGRIATDAVECRLEYPFTTEISGDDPSYAVELGAFYEVAAAKITKELAAGRDVALLCEGDPFFYGSSLALLDRLSGAYRTEVVPGVTGMSACWTRAGLPMARGDEVLTVLPGTLSEDQLVERLSTRGAAVILKVGRNLEKIRTALKRAGLLERATYVERGTTVSERIVPISQVEPHGAPYFSLILVPARSRAS